MATTDMVKRPATLDLAAKNAHKLYRNASGGDPIIGALELAEAMDQLRRLLTDDVLKNLKKLENTTIGFQTDKPEGYPLPVIRDCFIDAVCLGLRPIGNEWNIISGRVYAAQTGLARLVREYPGLTNYAFDFETPKMVGDGALVPCSARWKLNGVAGSIDCTGARSIPIRVNRGMGADAILGKAERKLHAKVLKRLDGVGVPDGDSDDIIDVKSEPADKFSLTGPPTATQPEEMDN